MPAAPFNILTRTIPKPTNNGEGADRSPVVPGSGNRGAPSPVPPAKRTNGPGPEPAAANAPPLVAAAPAGDAQVLTSPVVPGEIKPIFRGLVRRGYDPRGPEYCITLVLGLRKHGKSTFALTHPGCVLLDFESGAHAVKYQQGCRVPIAPTDEEMRTGIPQGFPTLDPIKRFEHFRDLLLMDAKSGNPQFQTVCIDTVDALRDIMLVDFCKAHELRNITDYKDGKAGWFEVRGPLCNYITDIKNAGYGVIVNCHLREKHMKNNDGTDWVLTEPWLSQSFKDSLFLMADQIIHLSREITVVKKPPIMRQLPTGKQIAVDQGSETRLQTVLRSRPGPNMPEIGCRVEITDGLPIDEKTGWATYAAEFNRQVSEAKKELAAWASGS